MVGFEDVKDVKELRDIISSNWDAGEELEELLSQQSDEELTSKYILRFDKGFLREGYEEFGKAEDLVKFYNQELNPRDGTRGKFAVGTYEPERKDSVVKALARADENKAAVVRGNSWAVDIHKALSITNESRREESKEIAKDYLSQVFNFRDLMKPWKRPHYSDIGKVVDGLEEVYWEAYEQDAIETLESTILRSAAEAHNPDRRVNHADPSFYRELVEEY